MTEKRSTTFKFLISYLAIIHLILLISIRFDFAILKPFPVIEILSVGVIFFLINNNFIANAMRNKQTVLFHTISISIIYYLFTILCYFQYGNSYSIVNYLYGIHHCILPILLFYLVQLLHVNEVLLLLKRILFLNFFMCFIGILFFLLQPDFYTDYLKKLFNDLNLTELWQLYGRLQSYLGSTSVGNVATVSFVLTYFLIKRSSIKFLYFFTFGITVIFTQQRGPILLLLLAVFIILINFLLNSSAIKKLIFFAILSISIIVIVKLYSSLITDEVAEIFNYTVDKIANESNPGEVLSERAIGYVKAVQIIKMFPLGVGLGASLSASEQASNSGLGQIVDANFARILADTGIIGLLLFIVILVLALYKSIKSRRLLFFTITILLYSFQALGTNVFDSFICIHLFWIFLGILNNKNNNIIWKQSYLQEG
jgi:hypothetical protein